MTGLTRTTPSREFNQLRREMDRLFTDFFPTRSGEGRDSAVWMPRADLAETEDAFLLSLDLPGIPAEQVDVTLEDDTLSVSGTREVSQEQKDGRFHRIERHYGRFFRSFQFATPVDAENVEASFDDGVLTVRVAKAEASKPRRIEVRRNTQLEGNSGDGAHAEETEIEVNTPEG
ncbi:MAG: Hsp20/alpha crystallin family protein [Rhodothermaceae bacterium]|nr:Hsp20/alpha crystallin family protein [Rhodothermaceae bacterium]